MLAKLTEFKKEIDKESNNTRASQNKEMYGLKSNLTAINPINGEEVSIWITNYVLSDYGSGAIMGVPAHDERDHKFATKYKLRIKHVVKNDEPNENHNDDVWSGEGTLINSYNFNGKTTKEAKEQILVLGKQKGWAKKIINYRVLINVLKFIMIRQIVR